MICMDCYKSFEGMGMLCPKCHAKRESAGTLPRDSLRRIIDNKPKPAASPVASPSSLPAYYPISPAAFVTFSVLTGGLFLIFWIYRSWSFIRRRDESRIWPWARTMFSHIWCYQLLKDIDQHTGHLESVQRRQAVFPIIAAWGVFCVLTSAHKFSVPYSVLGFFAFFPLLPFVSAVHTLNASQGHASRSPFSPRKLVLTALIAPLAFLGFLMSFNIIPAGETVPGWLVWPGQRQLLVDRALLPSDEEIVRGYFSGFSIADRGSFFTPERLVTYRTDAESGEITLNAAPFNEIHDIVKGGDKESLNYDEEPITVTLLDGRSFIFAIPIKDSSDLYSALRTAWGRTRTKSGA